MATQVEQLIGRLRDAGFRKQFLAVCAEATSAAGGFCNDPPGAEYEDLQGEPSRSPSLTKSRRTVDGYHCRPRAVV
jgi:hypothetical protein